MAPILPHPDSIIFGPPPGELPQPQPGKSPVEEEMDEEDESQWNIRIGNEPPPPWAKRKATEDGSSTGIKRQRTECVSMPCSAANAKDF
jgi:hypothetical protein